jgi:hypothetical protein
MALYSLWEKWEKREIVEINPRVWLIFGDSQFQTETLSSDRSDVLSFAPFRKMLNKTGSVRTT